MCVNLKSLIASLVNGLGVQGAGWLSGSGDHMHKPAFVALTGLDRLQYLVSDRCRQVRLGSSRL